MIDNVSVTFLAKHISLYSGSTLLGVASIGFQLQARHKYMQLDLPLWLFLIATVFLIFAGAAFSLRTDTLRSEPGKLGKYLTACGVGIIVTFIVLPLVVTEPNPVWIMFTGVMSSFSGTVLLYLLTKVLQDKALHDAIIETLTTAIRDFVVGSVSRAKAVWDALTGKTK